jgi:hypothetical protein
LNKVKLSKVAKKVRKENISEKGKVIFIRINWFLENFSSFFFFTLHLTTLHLISFLFGFLIFFTFHLEEKLNESKPQNFL